MSAPCRPARYRRAAVRPAWRLAAALLVALLPTVASPLGANEEVSDGKAWSNETELSLVETAGNSDSTTFSMKNRYRREWSVSTLTVDANALRADSTERLLVNEDGEAREIEIDKVTAEQYGLSVKYDRAIGERLGWFVFGGWRRNQLAGIDDRYNLDAGISHAFLKSASQSLVAEAGFGFTDEYPVVGSSESFVTARALSRYERQLSPTSSLETELEAIQNLDRTDDLRINFLLGVTAKINTRLAMKASYTLSYDGQPASQILPGDEPGEPEAVFEFDGTDTILAVSLVIDF